MADDCGGEGGGGVRHAVLAACQIDGFRYVPPRHFRSAITRLRSGGTK